MSVGIDERALDPESAIEQELWEFSKREANMYNGVTWRNVTQRDSRRLKNFKFDSSLISAGIEETSLASEKESQKKKNEEPS